MEGGKEKCERDRCGWEEIMKEETGKEEIIVKKTEMKAVCHIVSTPLTQYIKINAKKLK